MGVVGFGQGVVGHVRVEEFVALGAAMLRVDQFDVAGPTSNQVAHVMQHAGAGPIAKARLAAPRTGAMWEVATAPNDLRLRQIFRARDALGGVRQILSGTRHGKALLGQVSSARNLRHLLVRVMANFHAMMLKTLVFSSFSHDFACLCALSFSHIARASARKPPVAH